MDLVVCVRLLLDGGSVPWQTTLFRKLTIYLPELKARVEQDPRVLEEREEKAWRAWREQRALRTPRRALAGAGSPSASTPRAWWARACPRSSRGSVAEAGLLAEAGTVPCGFSLHVGLPCPASANLSVRAN